MVFEIIRRQFEDLISVAETDGCTLVPDFNFRACCAEHDFYYNYDVGVTRWEADAMLYQCIRDAGRPGLALTYWMGVRSFGRLFYGRRETFGGYNPQPLGHTGGKWF